METKIIITKKDDQILIHFPDDVVFMNPETLELTNELLKRGIIMIGFSSEFDRPKRDVELLEIRKPKKQNIAIEPSRDLCRYCDICQKTKCSLCHAFIPK